MRAFTAVPFHAVNGVIMGYYLGLAKFTPENRKDYIKKALLIPFLFHGFYDFCLMVGYGIFILIWIPFLIYLFRIGFKRMKKLSDESIFRDVDDSNAN